MGINFFFYLTEVPPGSIQLLQELPYGVPEIEITAKYPIVEGQSLMLDTKR